VPRRHALLAGGGTGGHVFPALAVGEALAAREFTVSYTGLESGMEARLTAERGLRFDPLPARPVLGKSAGQKAAAIWTLGRSALAARRLVRRLDACVVVGTGGYVSAPAVLGARLAGRPAFLVEPNARAGAANRWLSRFAQGAAVAHEEARADLRCPSEVLGVPVRDAFFAVPEARFEGPPRLLVLGGSQGARALNRELPAAVAARERRTPGLEVTHQAGAKQLDEARAAYAGAGVERVRVVPFIDDIAAAMADAWLVVSRSGAITTAEICAAGRASLLLPLEIAAGHQEQNARALERGGAARVRVAGEATSAGLEAELGALLGDTAQLAEMARRARSLAKPGAAAAIASRVDALTETSR
jgi:UDP-N-acetylglucosamine--N-acetylmuramyl-(pentapeptide) pyrophosphoryl-undecaprenol N-acetylglucosamine transferase